MSKNGLIAALWTGAIIGSIWCLLYFMKNYPQWMGYLFTGLLAVFIYLAFIYPLWDTIKYELDKKDEKKRGECNLDLDEDDITQIG